MIIVGIDPGKTGGYAVMKDGVLVDVVPFKADLQKCRSVFHLLADLFVIERVTSSPNQGVTSAFTFGKYAEAVETAARLTGKEVLMARPQKWQSALGCISGGSKPKLYAFAKQQFPLQYAQKMFKQDTADATLIALYGYKHYKYNG